MLAPDSSNAGEPILFGRVVVLRRDGQDSVSFDLNHFASPPESLLKETPVSSYVFGSGPSSDVRIQLPKVGDPHCRVFFDNRNVSLSAFS